MTNQTRPSLLDRIYCRINRPFVAWDRADRRHVAYALATGSSKTWTVDVGSASHVVDLEMKGDFAIRINVDGERAGAVAPPDGRSPRREATVGVAGTPVVIALEWRADWPGQLWVDLFVDGKSVTDGTALEASRAAAPKPTSGYDDRMREPQVGGALGVGVNNPAGCLFFMAWLIPVAFVNEWLLRHRELGDGRWLVLALAAVGSLVLLVTIVVVVVAAAGVVLG